VSSKGRTRPGTLDNGDEISLIVGGSDAGVGAHTHQVALFGSTSIGSFTCGGILVAHDLVITAAHCVDYVNVARIGLYYLDNPAGSETINICQKVSQPNGDDIALLKLCQASSLAQQGTVKTIKLNANPNVPTVGQVLTVTGWGDTTEGGSISNTLQKVDVNYVSQDTCVAIYGVNAREMCAGVTGGGKDSCQGDSGGPLITGTSASNFVLVGVVSGGTGCARPEYPGIYNRVSAEVSWVLTQGCAMTSILPCGIQTTSGNPLAAPKPAVKPVPRPVVKPAPRKPAPKPAPKPVSTVVFKLILNTDLYGFETGWKLTRKDSPSGVIMEKVAGSYASSSQYVETLNLARGYYEFLITDTYGDGLTEGETGGYNVTVGGVVAHSGRNFREEEKLFLYGY
jgi:trypsin